MADKTKTFDFGPAPADEIGEAASAWLARRDRGLSVGEERELESWRSADPRHEEEYSRLASEWESFDLARADTELVAMAQALDDETRSRVRPLHARRGPAAWVYGCATVAAAAAIVAVAWIRSDPQPAAAVPQVASTSALQPTYQILPSASHQLALEDGTIVTLRGDSEVVPEFTEAERRVRLVRGEAHFVVAKNPARPFVVGAGGIAVRAVGTAFNVRLEPSAVEVLVTEGKVRVNDAIRGESLIASDPAIEAPVLSAGERIVVNATAEAPAATAMAVSSADIELALSWQSTRLVFDRTPLADAIAAFNQQHGSHRLVFGDASLRNRLLGGTFRTDNVEGFVRLLELSIDVRAEYRDDGTIVLRSTR